MTLKKGKIKCPLCTEVKSGMMSISVHLTIKHKIEGIDLDMCIRGLRNKYG